MRRTLCLVLAILCGLTQCRAETPPAASADWATQLQVAQTAAAAYDPAALLTFVIAHPASSHLLGPPLALEFEFLLPSSELVTVSFVDSQITQTLHTDVRSQALIPAWERPLLQRLATDTQVSAADAIAVTQPARPDFATDSERVMAPSVTAILVWREVASHADPVIVWRVAYRDPGPQRVIRFTVNAQTGALLEQDEAFYGAERATPTPAQP
ncbi:MAG: hypothetical protein MI924_21505 [Chloroflexales bacterium]|nr:hypothetical protein [Chloroflexales bacterium]